MDDFSGAVAEKTFSIIISDLNITTEDLPPAPAGVAYSEVFTVAGGSTPYIWTLFSGSLPTGFTISSGGVISNTPAAVVQGNYSFTVQVEDGNAVAITKGFSLVVTDLVITTPTLRNGAKDLAYSEVLSASGGDGIYKWSLDAGVLPTGLTLDENLGSISGTPTAKGSATFRLKVEDTTGLISLKKFTISISDLNITNNDDGPELTQGSIGAAYLVDLTVEGGTSPYTFAVAGGVLPTGLTINTGTGTISGTPTVAANFTFDISVTDSSGFILTESFSIRISNLSLIGGTLPSLTVGEPNTLFLDGLVSGGSGVYNWTLESGNLPNGMTLNPAGILTGTPSQSGYFTFALKVTDSNDETAIALYGLVVGDISILTDSPLDQGIVGQFYDKQIVAYGGDVGPYVWLLSSGTLPFGLNLTTTAGGNARISGTPITTGGYTFTIRVEDSGIPEFTNKIFTIQITDLFITTGTLSDASVDTSYSAFLNASGGSGIYTWAVTTGSLPAGLTLDVLTGEIGGTASAEGKRSFVVTVTDSDGLQADKIFTINVTDLQITDSQSLPSGAVSAFYDYTFAASGGSIPYTWTNPSGTMPTGLTLNPNSGRLRGTIDAAAPQGTYTFQIAVTDGTGTVVSKQFQIYVSDLAIATSSPLVSAIQDTAYQRVIVPTAGSGTPPYIFSVVSPSVLPPGLTLNSSTGLISGTPTGWGTYYFVIRLTDWKGNTAETTFQLDIAQAGAGPGGGGGGGGGAAADDEGGTACYIATAAYGSYLDGNVQVLRDFRDEYLLASAPGRALVALYDRTSPPVADFIAQRPALRLAVRATLTPVIYAVKFPLIGLAFVFGAAGAGIARRRRQKV